MQSHERLDQIREAYSRLGSWRAVARELGIPRWTVRHYQQKLKVGQEIAGGDLVGLRTEHRRLPRRGQFKRYILTCAQNNTLLNEEAWRNLLALKDFYEAELMVSRFTYAKDALSGQLAKPGSRKASDTDEDWYAPEIVPYVSDKRVELAPGLVWCGESNISPTAIRPLSGLETYTGRKSAIFPHTKIAMESIASGKNEGVKLLFTTGTVTQKNYIQRKAGLKAEFHHTYGALLVEVDGKGRWFCRQLNVSERDGTLCDLDLVVKNGRIETGRRIEAITFGDFHTAQLDPDVAQMIGDMIATLKPRKVFLHDLVDFRARNHHDRGNPHLNFRKFVEGEESVQEELQEASSVLSTLRRTGPEVVVVQSNHDNALLRWLREADYRSDPVNALIFLKCQAKVYEAIAEGDEGFHLIEWILQELGCPPDVRFLRTDESFVICRDKGSGIECGMHGHLGPNGSRGSPNGLRKMGRRANIGHTHSACIIEGLYVAGTSSLLDVGYNEGPSSWTHSHILTYENGKRAIVTMYGGAWRAE